MCANSSLAPAHACAAAEMRRRAAGSKLTLNADPRSFSDFWLMPIHGYVISRLSPYAYAMPRPYMRALLSRIAHGSAVTSENRIRVRMKDAEKTHLMLTSYRRSDRMFGLGRVHCSVDVAGRRSSPEGAPSRGG
jgi:hypothetical protein